MVRLQKYLAECGVASRREAERFITEGRVRVNDTVATLGQSIDPAIDQVTLDGSGVAPQRLVYIVLNKPRGVVTTAKDTHGRKTVLDYVDGAGARVFPVGRLDMDVEGALLLTSDGELAYRLMHPKFEVDKIYVAWVVGRMTPETAARIEKGIQLEDGPTAPARVSILRHRDNATQVRLTLHEGRKREVKRMCEAAGHPVQTLHREQFGGIGLGGIRPGEWRHLSEKEIQSLWERAGLQGAPKGA